MKITLSMDIENQPVSIEFYWYGDEPEWDTMDVLALLPSGGVNVEAKYLVKVNDLLSDSQWLKIEEAIYWNEDKLKLQAQANEY